MAKRRSIAELRRALKRRLLHADIDQVERTARDLRSFAVASRFYAGYSIESIEGRGLAGALDRSGVECAIRNQSARRR